MSSRSRHHHWLIGLGLCVLLFASALLTRSLHASVSIQSLQSAFYSELIMQENTVVRGQGIVATPEYEQLSVATYTVHLLDGALYMAVYGSDLTVASLNAPALIEDTNGATLLLLPGMQWHSTVATLSSTDSLSEWWHAEDVSTIPAAFLQQQLARVPVFTPASESVGLIEEQSTSVFAQVDACTMRECTEGLLSLLPQQSSAVLRESLVFAVAQHSPTIAELAALHPHYSARTITMLPWASRPQHLLTSIEYCLEHLCSEVVQIELLQATKQYMYQAGFTNNFATTVAQVLKTYAVPEYASAYPVRFEFLTQLTSQLREFNINVELPAMGQASTKPVAEEPEYEQVETTIGVLTEQEVLDHARQILDSLGAMYTVETSLMHSGVNTALVENIVLPSSLGDRLFTFTLHVKRGEVLQLQEGSMLYPNRLWLEDFLVWLHQS